MMTRASAVDVPEAAVAQAEAAPSAVLPVADLLRVALELRDVVCHTPLARNANLSERYDAEVLLKREDLQVVRSYKLRGAYNKLRSLSPAAAARGVVCASAGNHAQGVAYCCRKLGITGRIFMPGTTPGQKVRQVELFGRDQVTILLQGDSFDDANRAARADAESSGAVFIPPFDDPEVIAGQGSVAVEILGDARVPIDVLLVPVGGGGLAAGVGSVFKQLSPETRVIGVEPEGAAAMRAAFDAGRVVDLDTVDPFVDGAAVRRVGELTFPICREVLDDLITVPEGRVCTTILSLYDEEAIVVEPAGALAVAALESLGPEIRGKNVVCVVSGSNNDITRTEEIKERSLLHEGLKHYFIIRFPQRAGALREFLVQVLGPEDDITHFAYSKKSSRDRGPALIGIELKRREDFPPLLKRLGELGFVYEYLNDKPDLFQYLI